MIKARIRWCTCRVENILTLGKLLSLWFCFLLHSILFLISQTSYRTYKIISRYEFARPLMGTIFSSNKSISKNHSIILCCIFSGDMLHSTIISIKVAGKKVLGISISSTEAHDSLAALSSSILGQSYISMHS